MRNGRNTNSEFSLVLHKFIAPAGEKKNRKDRDTERLTNRDTERQKEEEEVGGGVVIREGNSVSSLPFINLLNSRIH